MPQDTQEVRMFGKLMLIASLCLVFVLACCIGMVLMKPPSCAGKLGQLREPPLANPVECRKTSEPSKVPELQATKVVLVVLENTYADTAYDKQYPFLWN